MDTTDVTEEIIAKREKILSEQNNDIETRIYYSLLTKFKLSKLLRIIAFIEMSIHNCLNARHSRALTTEEIKLAEAFWIKVAQIEIDEVKSQFQFRRDQDKVFRCYGKVPRKHLLAEKIAELCHDQTMH